MPKKVRYYQGMNVPQSESDGDDQSHEDIWDDSQLNAAYDKALKLANVEVAKRIAMSTNSKKDSTKHGQSPKQDSKSNQKKKWSLGMSCRAVYEEDGLEYEAFVVRILNDKECIIKFLGYGNTDRVKLDTLKPSQGEEVQKQQIEMAMIEKWEESDASVRGTSDDEERAKSPGSTERSYNKKNSRKRKRNPRSMDFFQLPDFPMPNLMASMDIPMPPPFPLSGFQCEEEAISSMLVSWYMSGYHTGLYQGLKRFKANKRQKD